MAKNLSQRYSQVVLDGLDASRKDSLNSYSSHNSLEVKALQELVEKTVGVNEEVKEAKPGPSPKMTQQELKAMKSVSTRVQEPEVQLIQKISHALVKGWLAIKSWFVYKDAKRKVCQQIGHHCSHCGMTVPFQHEQEIQK